MDIKFKAGLRVLYKKNGNWKAGVLQPGNVELTSQGLFVNVFDVKDQHLEKGVNANTLYFNCTELEDWMKDPSFLLSKEDFLARVEEEGSIGNSFVSDGDYMYYPVSKCHEAWINKQPFDYVFISPNF